jgi:anaerobic selenocysteine-containing dehydrogenase
MNKFSTKSSRRSFIKTVAITGGAVGTGAAFTSKLKAFAKGDGEIGSHSNVKGEWKSTTCQGCTSWCAIQVYVVNGRAIKIKGNPNSKVNGSECCSKSHLSLQQVYDPDRLKTPMKRTNPNKGRNEDPKFVPISWDEATNTIADKIMELRKNNETHKYMLLRGRYSYMRDVLYSRMTSIIGSKNNISHSAICAEAEKFGPYYTEGEWTYRQYDILNSRYILIWGADPLSANRQVSYYLSNWGNAMENAQVAVVEPRLTASAAKASEWLPVKPGYDSALASAIAHVILTEGLWYKEFVGDFNPLSPVKEFTAGVELPEEYDTDSEGKKTNGTVFNELHTHGLVKWWNATLKDKTPEWAAEITGISAQQIRRVASDYGKAAPHAISWVGGGVAMQPRGGYSSMMCHALNGLVGSVDNIGGTLKANKEYTMKFPSDKDFLDDIAHEGKSHKKIDHRGRKEFPGINAGKPGGGVITNNAAEGILNEDPNEIKVLIGYMHNFAYSCTGAERWERALSKIPFSVHLTTNAAESSMFADILLPACTSSFEKWGYVKAHGNGYRHVTMLQPVIDRIWDVKIDETEVPWMIAEKLAERGFDNLLNHYKEYIDPETGLVPTNETEFGLYALKYATQNLWDPVKYKGGDKLNGWADLHEKGVWNSDPYPYRKRWGKMKTKTKKFEFYSETLKAALESHAEKHKTGVDDIMETCNYIARGELAFMPHFEEPYVKDDPKKYPFAFIDFKSRFNREGRSANSSWYHDMKDYDPGDEAHADVARINPVDAIPLGINNGDKIRISSSAGSLECTAKLWEGVRPGTVSKCFGQGHWAYGHIASEEFGKKARGGNNNDVILVDYDRMSGSTARHGGFTRVRIDKV